ncbi:hypothetical protein ACVILK_005060 [Bradyrhizobium embrapense]
MRQRQYRALPDLQPVAAACGSQVNASYQFQLPQILNPAPFKLTAAACFQA